MPLVRKDTTEPNAPRDGAAELAADLTAETFAAALGSLASYLPDRGEFPAWLFGIARHVLARSLERGRVEDQARRRLGMPPVHVDDETIERIEQLASMNGAALTLLDELPEPVRAAIFGRVLEEREYSELAESLACSKSVVRQRETPKPYAASRMACGTRSSICSVVRAMVGIIMMASATPPARAEKCFWRITTKP